jgi:proteasome beta subunit
MTYPAEKLHPLGEFAAWGGSGARSVLFDVERTFNENSLAILEAPDIGRALQEQVIPILRHHYGTFISDVPGDEGGGTP